MKKLTVKDSARFISALLLSFGLIGMIQISFAANCSGSARGNCSGLSTSNCNGYVKTSSTKGAQCMWDREWDTCTSMSSCTLPSTQSNKTATHY